MLPIIKILISNLRQSFTIINLLFLNQSVLFFSNIIVVFIFLESPPKLIFKIILIWFLILQFQDQFQPNVTGQKLQFIDIRFKNLPFSSISAWDVLLFLQFFIRLHHLNVLYILNEVWHIILIILFLIILQFIDLFRPQLLEKLQFILLFFYILNYLNLLFL